MGFRCTKVYYPNEFCSTQKLYKKELKVRLVCDPKPSLELDVQQLDILTINMLLIVQDFRMLDASLTDHHVPDHHEICYGRHGS